MRKFEGLVSGDFLNLFGCQTGFSDDGAHSDIGVDQVDCSVSSRVEHFIKIENII